MLAEMAAIVVKVIGCASGEADFAVTLFAWSTPKIPS